MSKQLTRYLSPLDATFLYAERPSQTMHIGSCMIYEGRMEKEELARLIEERLHLIPRYRQRVVFPPMVLSHPFWLDDPDFDINNHIDVVELEGEVDDRRLAEATAAAYEGMLDRDHPLWSATLIHGLPDDDTAIVWKVHHCMIDGVSGVDLTIALNSLTPDIETPEPPETQWKPDPIPDSMSLLQEAVQHRAAEATKAWTEATFDMFRPEKMLKRAQKMSSGMRVSLPKMLPAPTTSFNKRVSGKLACAWATFSFTEMRQIKSELGGTVNDLVLTILSGALGRYLRARGERTEGVELRSMCPVSMRQADQHDELGNLVSVMTAPLYIGIEDPLLRHQAEREGMTSLKEAGQADAFHEMNKLGDFVPPSFQGLMSLFPVPSQTLFNTVSTNVPGPQIPMYQAGRKLKRWLPLGILSSNIGLFVPILTYHGQITLGVTADPEQVPDPWQVTGFIEEAYEELRALAGVEVSLITLRPVRARQQTEKAADSSRAASGQSSKAGKKAARKKTGKQGTRARAKPSSRPRGSASA